MKPGLLTTTIFAVLTGLVASAMAHENCTPRDRYLRGKYSGGCDHDTHLPEGLGTAKGADTYIGEFVKGIANGKGTYIWENGAKLEGAFRNGKAHGPGFYITRDGVRYDGEFIDGKLKELKPPNCPTTPGPLSC